MDESIPAPGAVLAWPRPVYCPPWCTTEGRHHGVDPPGTAVHRSPPATVPVYDEACAPRSYPAAFYDKAPDRIGSDPSRPRAPPR
ncbi:hypothetical protein EV385_0519 [Krasilnikovia cinnamomea]|uniref:Uncharacterized protein n=1 Tax=Krasilnikovia cinnamomea TaxID=349313 RepID=A0A4Q7ZFC4_9ACTN|nr:hypothetical protein [Krasilnikovia cinnamomea]RZU48795.1 hypothetical protein EV385_0519 [Krasilnikovia cinnamomea]